MSKGKKALLAFIIIFIVFGFIFSILVFTTSTPTAVVQMPVTEREKIAEDVQQRLKTINSYSQSSNTNYNAPQNPVYSGAPVSPSSVNAYPSRELVLSEKEVNALIQHYIATDPRIKAETEKNGLSDPGVVIHENRLQVFAKVRYDGIKLPVSASADILDSSENKIKFVVTDLRIGRIGVPGSVRNNMINKIYQVTNNGEIKLPSEIKSAELQEGKLIVRK